MKKSWLLLIAGVALLTGCGGGGGSEVGPGQVGQGGIDLGGVFKVNEVEDFRNLSPLSVGDVVSHRIANQVYEGLVKLDQSDLSVIPSVAESWEINDDATVFTFKLREGVNFHDDECFSGGKGRAVVAQDFVYTLTRACEANSDNLMFWLFDGKIKGAREYYNSTMNGEPLAEGVTGFRAIDEKTLEIELNYPFAGLLNILAHPVGWVYPKEAVDMYGVEMRTHAVGTGPFTTKTVKDGDVVILAKNKNYYRKDEFNNPIPYLDAIKFTFTKEKKSELLEFRSERLDMVFQLPLEMIDDVVGELKDAQDGGNVRFSMQVKPSLSVQYYGFQHNSEIFSNKLVRQAFNYAIDRDKIVNYTLQGDGEPAHGGIVPPAFADYDYSSLKGYDFDPEKAQALLAEAGYPGGKGLPVLKLQLNSGGSNNLQIAEVIKNMLAENLGVEVEMDQMPMAQHYQNVEAGNTDFWRAGWVADYPDPENFLNLLYGGHVPANDKDKSYINPFRFKNATYDSLFDLANREPDPIKRNGLFRDAEQIMLDEAAVMPIYYDEFTRLVSKRIKNFPQNAMEYRDLSQVWIDKDF